MLEKQDNTWYCKKCNKQIQNCIDIDYHENTEHPNYEDNYIKSWYKYGKRGLSPYD